MLALASISSGYELLLLGSHKKRDNRCAIAAPKLEAGLTTAFEREHWEVHTQVAEPASLYSCGSDADRLAQLKSAAESKTALILKTSHIGGHKFSGNVIVGDLVLYNGSAAQDHLPYRFTRLRARPCGMVALRPTMLTRLCVTRFWAAKSSQSCCEEG